MVHLCTVGTSFQARVLAARLGSEGIVTQLRGAVDGPYPFGEVLLFVDVDDAQLARHLLLADEVEAAFDSAPDPWSAGRPAGWPTTVQVVLAGGAVVLVTVASTVARLL